MTISGKPYRYKITLGQTDNTLQSLIAINLVLFILFAFIKMIFHFRYDENEMAVYFYNKDIISWFALPASTDKLLSRPWTIITHMFVQVNIWKIFTNMIWLWSFGFILQELTGNKKLIPVYIYGALGGALGFILSYHFLPGLQTQIPVAASMGASAGVMAVAVCTTLVAPDYRIFPLLKGGIPLWVLTFIYLITDFATIYQDKSTLVMHLAGAFTGICFMFFLKRGYDWSHWMNQCFDWVGNLFNPDRPGRGKNIREELFYKSTTDPYIKSTRLSEKRIDEILDKINQQGYDSLTDEEKKMLKKAGEEDPD